MTQSIDKGWSKKAPPLQGRGLGWGLSVEQIDWLHQRAAEMRRNPTEPEKRLWRYLSNSRLDGHKFRRQSVIGRFIADFLCPQKALIVEVDGDTHDDAKDRLRDDELASFGFRVARVTNHDVMASMEGVLQFIQLALNEAPDRWDRPHPNPVRGKNCPAIFRSCRGHDRPRTPEGEGLEEFEAHKLLGISLEGSVG